MMSYFRRYIQRTSNKWFIVFLIVVSILVSSTRMSAAQSETGMAAPAYPARVAELLQKADTHFEKQEFTVCYDLYLTVLNLDPANQHAWDKLYTIINSYKDLTNTAQQQKDNSQTEFYAQKYQDFVRILLKRLTAQLKEKINKFGKLTAAEKAGEDVKEEMVPVLENIIPILTNLKTIYEEFSRQDEETSKIIERISLTIKKYEQELLRYQE